MELGVASLALLCILFLIIALIYSSVGFGGGSSYLALLALMSVSFYVTRSLALVCNIVVVGGSIYWFLKNRHFKLSEFLPFVVTSVPMAFLGASYKLTEQVFFLVLGIVLVLVALILFWQTTHLEVLEREPIKTYPNWINYFLGGSIGLLSGLVGIGGGIFLAPVLYYLKWGPPTKIAALASFFILVNSISALSGLIYSDDFKISFGAAIFLGLSVFIGGQLGVRYSFKNLSSKTIRRLTALLVLIVGVRVLLINALAL